MFSLAFARRSGFVGISASFFGIILYSQLGRVVDLRVGLWAVNFTVILSLSLTLLGLLAILVAGITWAWRAPVTQLLPAGLCGGIAALGLVEFADINVHGPTAVLMPVVCVISLGSVLMLLIAFRRFI
jgi:hypothetical protein